MATAESRFSCPVEDTLELFCEKKQNRNFCVKEMEGVAKKLFLCCINLGGNTWNYPRPLVDGDIIFYCGIP